MPSASNSSPVLNVSDTHTSTMAMTRSAHSPVVSGNAVTCSTPASTSASTVATACSQALCWLRSTNAMPLAA